MSTYRIFTNDRETRDGVPMYSCFAGVDAESADEAVKMCPPQFDAPHYAPAKAIRWPQSAQTADERAWLKKYVGEGL